MKAEIQYLNKTVWARVAPSPIHGVGVFAIRDIPKGTKFTDYNLVEHNGESSFSYLFTEEEMRMLEPEILSLVLDKMLFPADAQLFSFHSPNDEASLRSFMNHSTDANTDGFVALRDIRKGEELTEDYSSFYEVHRMNLDNFNHATD